jgi:tubulin beta
MSNNSKQYELLGAKELTRELFSSRNSICLSELEKGKLLTAAAIFRGKIETSVVEGSLASIKQKNNANFVEWIPDNLLSSVCQVPNSEYPVSAVMLGNMTSIQSIFKRIDSQYAPMLKRKAFMHHYIKEGLEWSEMEEARSNMLDLISEYQQYEVLESGEFEEEDEEDEVFNKKARSETALSDHHSTEANSHRD